MIVTHWISVKAKTEPAHLPAKFAGQALLARILSARRGKSKKRSRNELFLTSICKTIQKQQEAADDRFFRMEEKRQNREVEREEKRRKEERKHEMMIIKMIADMLGKVSSNFQEPAAVAASYSGMQQGHAYQPSQPHVPQQPFNGIFNMALNSEEPKESLNLPWDIDIARNGTKQYLIKLLYKTVDVILTIR